MNFPTASSGVLIGNYFDATRSGELNPCPLLADQSASGGSKPSLRPGFTSKLSAFIPRGAFRLKYDPGVNCCSPLAFWEDHHRVDINFSDGREVNKHF